MDVKADYLFEASWEVCNKVGGIYTVVTSKAALINEKYKNYFLIGPYIEEKARGELVEEEPPKDMKKVCDALKKDGIICHYGTWQVKGEPKVVLLDFESLKGMKNDIKKALWDNFQVDSLFSNWDFEEPMIWATAVGKLIEKFCQIVNKDNKAKVAAHFHEWLAGFALLYLKQNKVKVGTVFTTHATMLGRSIAGSGEPLYEMIDNIDPEAEAIKRGVKDKYSTEKACATNADVFTTVSEITGMEAEKLLGRKPDVLVLNGLDIERFPTFEETSIKHRVNRDIIREFIAYHFFPHYYFDIEQTLLFFIVGRYEYKNKGIDIFIKALAKLNERMKKDNSKKTVIAFFWIPREVHGAKDVLSHNKLNYHMIEDFIRRNNHTIQSRIIEDIMKCDPEDLNSEQRFKSLPLFDREFLLETKKLKMNFQKAGNPLVVTHNLPDENNDAIIKGFLDSGLDNKEDDKVKVIHYPVYLTGVDGLIDLPYYDALVGCHLGLFPSYYEPWGYTPLESAALGVPSLTTDLGGFGRFLMQKGAEQEGIFVLKRFGVSEEDSVSHFTNILHKYTLLNEKGRVKQKMAAKELSNLADWKELVNNYYEAHNIAVDKQWGN